MDPLSDVLSLLQVEDAAFRRIEAGGHWGLQSSKAKHVVFCALLDGPCWLIPDNTDRPIRMEAGDCFAISNGASFRLCSDLTTKAEDYSAPLKCRTNAVRRLGTGSGTSLIGGRFTFDDGCPESLLGVLPPTLYVKATSDSATSLRAIFHKLAYELDNAHVGKALMINHLAQVALLAALRACVTCEQQPSQGWLGALADAKIGKALSLMHADVAKRWTVADLATSVGMSRSKFALRFKSLVGLGPLDYLVHWRMNLAVRVLRGSNKPIYSVAYGLGYESESAFSNAFKRVVGYAPKSLRMREKALQAENGLPSGKNGTMPGGERVPSTGRTSPS
jgi:AraC-like DNA-binding protein